MRGTGGLMFLIAAGRFVAFTARMNIVPFYPELMARYGVSYTGAGGLFSAFFAGYALSLVPAGALADRVASWAQIGVGLLLMCGAGLGLVEAPTYALALVARALEGVGVAVTFTAILKLVAVRFTRETRGKAVGLMEMATGLGFLFALSIQPYLARWVDYRYLLFILPALCLGVLPLVSLARDGRAVREDAKERPPVPPLRDFLGRDLVLITATTLLGLFTVNGLLGWLPTYLTEVLGYSRGEVGLVTGILLLAQTLGVYPGGIVSDRLGRRLPVVHVGTVGLVAGFTSLALAGPGTGIYVTAAVFGLAMAWAVTPMMVLTTEMFGPERAGLISALTVAVAQAGSGVAGVFNGWILDRTGSFQVVWFTGAALAALRILTAAAIDEGTRARAAEQGR